MVAIWTSPPLPGEGSTFSFFLPAIWPQSEVSFDVDGDDSGYNGYGRNGKNGQNGQIGDLAHLASSGAKLYDETRDDIKEQASNASGGESLEAVS